MNDKELFEYIGRLYYNNMKSKEGLELQQRLLKDKDAKIKELEAQLAKIQSGPSN